MNDSLEQVYKGFFAAIFDQIGQFFANWHRKRRLKAMLKDKRFPKGFRSTKQLRDGIGCDEETTNALLLAIGARKSENSDEWTLHS